MRKQQPITHYNTFRIAFACFIIICSFQTIHAQGNWLWANYWTGNDDPLSSTNAYNYVVKTAFDEDGNIYAFGACGGTAQIAAQNQNVHMLNIPIVLTANTMGSVLAKYDRNGNLLWHRLIKNSGFGEDCRPLDMFFDGDRIMISGNYQFQANNNLWFFDTLITMQNVAGIPWEEQHPPYAVGNFTYFVSFDLDGNREESVFIHTLTREHYLNGRRNQPLGFRGGTICVDSQENTYIAVDVSYGGTDTMPFTIVIDKDTVRETFDVFFPENCYELEDVGWNYVYNTLLYKFSPDWELEWVHRVVDHTNGLSPYLPRDTVNPFFTPCTFRLNIDVNDELYLSGYITDMMIMNEYNQYPIHIYWDSVHYATVLNYGMAHFTPYIVKYDSNGNVLWSNQIYVNNEGNPNSVISSYWYENCVDDNGVYLMGISAGTQDYQPIYYFDSENYQLPNVDSYHHHVYFVKFDKQTGQFVKYGVTPGQHTSISDRIRPVVINNHLLFQITNQDFNTHQTNTVLCFFSTDGHFMEADTISFIEDNWYKSGGTIVSNDGYILCDRMNSQDLTFNHDLTLDLFNDNRSCAIIALKYDPSILEPYPTGIVQHTNQDDMFILYPNPTTDFLNIESKGKGFEQVNIVDINGKEIMNEFVHERHCIVNVSSLPAGMYLVKILSDGEWSVGKFIKTK